MRSNFRSHAGQRVKIPSKICYYFSLQNHHVPTILDSSDFGFNDRCRRLRRDFANGYGPRPFPTKFGISVHDRGDQNSLIGDGRTANALRIQKDFSKNMEGLVVGMTDSRPRQMSCAHIFY